MGERVERGWRMELRGPIKRVIPRLSADVPPPLAFLRANPFAANLASSLDLSCKHLPGCVVVTAHRAALH